MNDSPINRVAFVQACWHKELVDEARDSFLSAIESYGTNRVQVDTFEVSGSFEIPLRAKLLAKSGEYSAVVAAGLVVDGGIYRHEFVAQAVIDALMRVQLELEVPILSLVLIPHNFHEHPDHQQFFKQHLRKKGEEAARTLISILDNTVG